MKIDKPKAIAFTIIIFGVLWYIATGFNNPMIVFYSLIATAFVFRAMRYTNKRNLSNVGGGSSKMQELKDLTEMKKEGLISDEEYEKMKQEIIG